MPVSQNGWIANDRALIETRTVPGGSLLVRTGLAGDLLVYVTTQFHSRVEQLIWPGCWGYAERTIRGGTQLSNHASGTAIDLNAPRHPLGTVDTFTTSQVSAIRQILAECGGAIRWGGDYSGRKDEMHFEINAGPDAVATAAAKLGTEFKKGGRPAVEYIPVIEASGGHRELTIPMAIGVKSALYSRAWLSLAADRGGNATMWMQGTGMETVLHEIKLNQDVRWWTEIPERTEVVVLHADAPGSLGAMLEYAPK